MNLSIWCIFDPPFKSNQNYNVLFQEQDGNRAASQILAFKDTWTWDPEDQGIYNDLVQAGGRISEVMQAFMQLIGRCDMLSYLVMMAPRLMECRRALKPTGSMYLHCDPSASHYLKLLMDAVFGPGNFRNEVVWCYRKWSIASRQFARNHDCLLFYSKSIKSSFFNTLFMPLSEGTLKRWKGKKQQAVFNNGIRQASNLSEESKGSPMYDWWEISIINPAAKERLGYPTQKPVALLERIIHASCPEGGVVMDPFCGCGTTVAAAQKLKRTWIGIDITHLAITLIKKRLLDAFGGKAEYRVVGEPVSVTDAGALAASEPFQFQYWATGLVGARPVEEKKGADKGIDGKILFQSDKTGKFETVILSVKAGHTGVQHVRDLRGVVEREKAAIGVLISMQEPTGPMRQDAATGGFYESITWGRKYPKLQLLTISDLLAGKQIDMPPIKRTFKEAGRELERQEKQEKLFET